MPVSAIKSWKKAAFTLELMIPDTCLTPVMVLLQNLYLATCIVLIRAQRVFVPLA